MKYLSESSSLNISGHRALVTPKELKSKIPLTNAARNTVSVCRDAINNVLYGKDDRLVLIVGPCSVHDSESTLEYARRLKSLASYVEESIIIVMRAYLEKPRTTVGWKGLISDPDLDGTWDVEKGLFMSRELLLQITELGVPVATEALDPINASYLSDLVSWYAIGARTTESQIHRELASGLPAPVGFKNSTDGGLGVAINSIISVGSGQRFRGIDEEGQTSLLNTNGNEYGHIVLRGGSQPNYDADSIKICEQKLEAKKLPINIIVDCSHDNSQDVPEDTTLLKYGVSITDACIDWQTTEQLISEIHKRLCTVS